MCMYLYVYICIYNIYLIICSQEGEAADKKSADVFNGFAAAGVNIDVLLRVKACFFICNHIFEQL